MDPKTFTHKQNLIEIADQISKVVSTNESPSVTAEALRTEFKNDALEIAETCLRYYPGTRNAKPAQYWREVCACIIQLQMTKH